MPSSTATISSGGQTSGPYYKAHPERDPQRQAIRAEEKKAANERADERVASAVPTTIGGGGGGDDGSSQASIGITKEKMRRTVAQQGLFGANISKQADGTKEATKGKLSDAFKEACLKPTTTGATKAYRESLAIYADSSARSRDYLKRMINVPNLTTIVLTLMITMNYKDTPLDEDLQGLHQVFSVLNMLAADESDSKYAEQASAQATVDLEEALGQADIKCQRVSTKGFVDGKHDTKEVALTLLANMTCPQVVQETCGAGTVDPHHAGGPDPLHRRPVRQGGEEPAFDQDRQGR